VPYISCIGYKRQKAMRSKRDITLNISSTQCFPKTVVRKIPQGGETCDAERLPPIAVLVNAAIRKDVEKCTIRTISAALLAIKVATYFPATIRGHALLLP
jgi:hypothetical protein